MAEKKIELDRGGVGDLTSILHNQGVADLSWLAVDEEAYRAAEALPKQNLDMIPELQKALTIPEGEDVPHLIPFKPHVIVNRNPVDSPQLSSVDMTNPIRNRVARLIMEGLTPSQIQEKTLLEFSEADVRRAGHAIASVMSERGILGNVYLNSEHFPDCHRQTKEDKKVVASCAKRALFVLSKPSCGGCIHNSNGRCASFQKRLVDNIPYGPKLAANYIEQFLLEKRGFETPGTSNPAEWKEAVRTAFLRTPRTFNPDGIQTIWTTQPVKKHVATAEEVQSFLERDRSSTETVLSLAYVKYARRMMDGKDDREFLVASGDPELVALSKEYGLLGHTWFDMDAAGGCKKVASVLLSDSPPASPDFLIRRSSTCSNCHCMSDGACSKLSESFKIISSSPSYDKRTLASALLRAVKQGRTSNDKAKTAISSVRVGADFRSLTIQANLYSAPESPVQIASGLSMWAGSTNLNVKAEMDGDEIRRVVSHAMNTGLSGRALQEHILKRYTKDDLSSFPELGKRFASEDGVQGSYFIDPTAYTDYGHGCDKGAKHFRKQGAPNVFASDKCTGCSLQTHPGWCSKYAKNLIRQVPDDVRASVLASKRRLPVISRAPVEDPVSKYGLATSLSFDIPGSRPKSVDISVSTRTVDGDNSD